MYFFFSITWKHFQFCLLKYFSLFFVDCALVLCLLLGEDFFSALHIFYVGSPPLKKHTWLLFGLHFPEWWIWEKRQPPFTLGVESVSLLQIAHILWSLFYSVAPWGAGLQVVRTAGNWKSQCLVYSRSRSAVITDLSYVPAKSLQSCSTLCDPMDCSPPGSSVHGIFRAIILEWGAIAFSQAMYLVSALSVKMFIISLTSGSISQLVTNQGKEECVWFFFFNFFFFATQCVGS